MLLFIEMLYCTLVVISIFFKLSYLSILFYLVDFCTIIIGEINMINNVDAMI